MGGLLHGGPWRRKPKPELRTGGAPAPPAPLEDRQPSGDELRGLCVSDSVCGMFAEIKTPAPRA